MQNMLRPVELLAVQYGVTLEDAKTVTENVFREYYHRRFQLIAEEISEESVFRKTLDTLARCEKKLPSDKMFGFSEDDELHNLITDLKAEVRVPFILSKFHSKTIAEITSILDLSEKQSLFAIEGVARELDVRNFDQRLQFLRKSYDRLPSLIEDENVFKIETADQATVLKKNEKKPTKKSFILGGLGALLLFLFSYAMVMNSGDYQQSTGEKFIETSVKEFDEQLDRRLKLAGLPDNHLKFNRSFAIGDTIKTKHELLIYVLRNQLNEKNGIDRKKAVKEQHDFMNRISLPNELITQLEKRQLKKDEKQSMTFLSELYESVQFLEGSYSILLRENMNKAIGDEYSLTGTTYMEKLKGGKESIPEPLHKAIDAMEIQGFSLKSHNGSHVYPRFGSEEIEKGLKEKLHPNTDFYISFVMNGFKSMESLSLNEQVEKLVEIEKDLLSADGQSVDMMAFNAYSFLFFYVSGFNDEQNIYTSAQTVKQEYQDAWNRVASRDEIYPSVQFMQDIINEMESTNWTFSAKRRDLILIIFSEMLEAMLLDSREMNN